MNICIDYLHVPSGCHAHETVQTSVEHDGQPWLYMWQEGNYACDCNRAIFCARLWNEAEPVSPDCGQQDYAICITRADTGQVLYQEEAWHA